MIESEFFLTIFLIIVLKVIDFKRLKFLKSFVIPNIGYGLEYGPSPVGGTPIWEGTTMSLDYA
jgi:hypothetical protein